MEEYFVYRLEEWNLVVGMEAGRFWALLMYYQNKNMIIAR
jgi:hypothetical protein